MTMPEARSIDTLADQRVQFAELEARLVDEFGATRQPAVHRAIEDERNRFIDASVHAFVPILVERSVRARLGGGH
jgi:hypothetical protein